MRVCATPLLAHCDPTKAILSPHPPNPPAFYLCHAIIESLREAAMLSLEVGAVSEYATLNEWNFTKVSPNFVMKMQRWGFSFAARTRVTLTSKLGVS